MPNLQEVAVIAGIAEVGRDAVAPALAAKLAAELPAIFGLSGAKVADVLAVAPGEALPLSRLTQGFQHNLERFGLAKTATPTDLYEAAEQQGFRSQFLNGAAGGHYASTREISLGDGHVLQQSIAGGRSLAFRETAFLNSDRSHQVSFLSGNFLREYRETWDVITPSFRRQFRIPQG
jgi:hypothetical protein